MINLEPISISDLIAHSKSAIPKILVKTALEESLPPAFVALRSLGQIRSGESIRWCSTFYIRELDNIIVCSCGFKNAPFKGRAEIGYAVSPQRRNRGIATAAISALVSIAFESR